MEILKRGLMFSKLNDFTYELVIKYPITKEEIIDVFAKMGIEVSALFDKKDDSLISGTLEYLVLPEGELLVIEKDKKFYIAFKDQDVKSLKINRLESEYECFFGDESIKDKRLKSFIDFLAQIKSKYTNIILYDEFELYLVTNLINQEKYNTIIEDDDILLLLPAFREKTKWMRLTIGLKETYEDIGYIEFDLSKNNFKYIGNVSYAIKKPFRNKGYATKALGLVKQIVREYGEDVDKCLYISTVEDNISSQCVILNNGGKLYYEGLVPKGDTVRVYNGVDYVKIYTIDVSSI